MYYFSHGTDLDIQERHNMEKQAEAFVDSFTASSGAGTPTESQVTDTAEVSGNLKSLFSGDSTVSDAFSAPSSSGTYAFLSQQTQDQLNPFHSARAMSRTTDNDFVDFLGPRLDDIQREIDK